MSLVDFRHLNIYYIVIWFKYFSAIFLKTQPTSALQAKTHCHLWTTIVKFFLERGDRL